MVQPSEADRRACARVRIAGVATVSTDTVRHFVVRNLSAGGALLNGRSRLEPGTIADVVLVLIALPHHVDVRMEVLRCESDVEGNALLGAAFRNLEASTRELIGELVVNQASQQSEPMILLADRRISYLRALGQQLGKMLSTGIVLAHTPLEIVRCLYNNPQIRTALVGRAGQEAWALQVMGIIADDFPRVRRVLVCSRTDVETSSAFLLSKVVDTVLPDTFTSGEIMQAMHAGDTLE